MGKGAMRLGHMQQRCAIYCSGRPDRSLTLALAPSGVVHAEAKERITSNHRNTKVDCYYDHVLYGDVRLKAIS